MTTEQKIDRLSAIVSEVHKLLKERNKPRLVKVAAIQELTGWDKNKMQWARRNGVVDFIETPDGILYDLNSLPESFIKKTHKETLNQ